MADYKKITVYEKHTETPFLSSLMEMDISTRRKILAGRNGSYIINGETGEMEGTQVFALLEKVDKETFTKIYRKGMVQMFNLSKSGIKVFGYFTTIAKPNKGEAIFEIDKCREYTGYKTDKPIMKGLAELLENQFIARSKYHYRYFINPTMFFNGNRVAFVKMYQQTPTNALKQLPADEALETDSE